MKISSNRVKSYSFLENNIKTGTKYIHPKELQDTFEITAKEVADKNARNFSLNSFSSVATTSFKGGIPNLSLYFEMRKKLKKANLPQQTKDDIILHANTEEARLIANKFLSDEKLYENQNIQEQIGNIISNCCTPELAKCQLDLMDKYISDDKLYLNKKIQEKIGNIISYSNTPEKNIIANKFLSDGKFYYNDAMLKNIENIICNSNTQQSVKSKFDLMNKYISEEKLYKNQSLRMYIAYIVRDCCTPEQAQAKINLMDKYISEPKFYENDYIQKNIGKIIDNYIPSEKR